MLKLGMFKLHVKTKHVEIVGLKNWNSETGWTQSFKIW